MNYFGNYNTLGNYNHNYNHNHNHNNCNNIHNVKRVYSLNINPLMWGPLQWNLLHEFAKYCSSLNSQNLDETEENILKELKNIIKTLPYILPCHACRKHCSNAYYDKKNTIIIKSCKDFKKWVWKMKSIVNGNTKSTTINYKQYNNRLITWSEFITEKQVIDLLFMVAYGYPRQQESESNRQEYFLTFFESVSTLCKHIQHLTNINKLYEDIQLIKKNNIIWSNYTDVLNFINDFHNKLYKSRCNCEKFLI